MKIINLSAIREILAIDDNDIEIERSSNLDNFSWDSMATVMLQSHIDDEYNVQIDPDDLPELQTVGCLDDFISSFK